MNIQTIARLSYLTGFVLLLFVALAILRLLNFGHGLGDLYYLIVIASAGVLCLVSGRFFKGIGAKGFTLVVGLSVLFYFALKVNHFGPF